MNSVHRTAALPAVGFPIRISPDQSLVSGSPTLFAATHVLLRLLSPRHPSCALGSLVIFSSRFHSSSEAPRRPRSNAVRVNLPLTLLTYCLLSCAYAVVKELSSQPNVGGANRDRTDDIQLAKLALSQLSYGPPGLPKLVGLDRFELSTPRLSSVCSNQLSYRPSSPGHPDCHLQRPFPRFQRPFLLGPSKPDSKPTILSKIANAPFDLVSCPFPRGKGWLLRKEVIQPQVPLRLPCYDFTPVTSHSLGTCLLAVSTVTSGATDSHGVTGGVYKARERIHRGVLIRDY
jgi:hypothetical protein